MPCTKSTMYRYQSCIVWFISWFWYILLQLRASSVSYVRLLSCCSRSALLLASTTASVVWVIDVHVVNGVVLLPEIAHSVEKGENSERICRVCSVWYRENWKQTTLIITMLSKTKTTHNQNHRQEKTALPRYCKSPIYDSKGRVRVRALRLVKAGVQ